MSKIDKRSADAVSIEEIARLANTTVEIASWSLERALGRVVKSIDQENAGRAIYVVALDKNNPKAPHADR